MAPRKAAEIFRQHFPGAAGYRVTLYGSLAATGKGHLTDLAILDALAPTPVEIVWQPDELLPWHPNGMQFEAIGVDPAGADSPTPEGSGADHTHVDSLFGPVSSPWQIYSLGGGAIGDGFTIQPRDVYDLHSMAEILHGCEAGGWTFWEYVEQQEGQAIWDFLGEIWQTMQQAIRRGLEAEGVLPGGLHVPRKACAFYRKTINAGTHAKRNGLLSAYALAVSEENASGNVVVTAPTCGSSGVLPSVLRYMQEAFQCPEASMLRALATAGLVGNLIKHNASISGAQVGCQGEVGAACAMAAAAATQLMGGAIRQVEYAASMALEHHLGLTCDPVAGLVQIPCIERNAFAALRAMSCADYAMFTDGSHLIPFDEVTGVMLETGNNLPSLYRETASGGLAAAYERRANGKA